MDKNLQKQLDTRMDDIRTTAYNDTSYKVVEYEITLPRTQGRINPLLDDAATYVNEKAHGYGLAVVRKSGRINGVVDMYVGVPRGKQFVIRLVKTSHQPIV